MESSVSNLSALAILDGDSLRYQSSAGGAVRQHAMVWNPEAVTEVLGRKRLQSWLGGAAPETTLTFFDISEGDFRRQRLVRGMVTRTTLDGSEREIVQEEEWDEGASAPTATTWYETSGARAAVRTVVRQLGVEIEIVRVTAAELEATQIEPSFDIIKRSMVSCPGFPTPASRMEAVTLAIDFPGPLPAGSMDGPNQFEISRNRESIELRLTRAAARRQTLAPAKRDVFLKPDRFVQSDAKEIRAVADSLRGAIRKDRWVLARSVAAWVDAHITKKGMEHGYSSALDVYRSRAGDCTEHSLLATAVLRAAGIPARPVVGLAFSEQDQAFVGHMWLEAYVDEWRTLDALNLGLDPIRIRVHAPESSEGLGERDLMRAYGVMAGVKVRAIDHRAR
jgi:transglutaminase-like putative cysteine protease